MKLFYAIVSVVLNASIAFAQVPNPAPTPAPSAVAPPVPIEFEKALLKASNDLFSKAALDGFTGNIKVVIDPLVDGITGARSVATTSEEQQIKALVKAQYPRFDISPFNSASLGGLPVVLIGTFTAINNAGVAGGPRDAYRICLALADLKSNKIISKGVARALPAGVDPTPTAFFADSPIYYKDAATDAYVKSCQGTKTGDLLPQVYADHILSAALLSNGIEEYNQKHYRDASDLYHSALKLPGGDQLRAYNGLYLTSTALHDRMGAKESLDKLIDYGIKANKIAIKFTFQKNSTIFVRDRSTRGRYGLWLSTIASKAVSSKTCLGVVGHTSATGLAAYNLKLSQLRADYIRERLEAKAPVLRGHIRASGKGSSELIVGTGRDDASDALDRRVELEVVKCESSI